MPPAGLDIDPQDVTANKHLSALVGTLHDTLHQSRHAFYSYVPDGLGLAEAFVARNPDDALRWICSQTTRGKILTLIKDVYEDLAREAARESPTKAAADDAQDATDKADDATEGPHDEPDGARDVTDADGSGRHGVKRKRALREKTTTTRAPNGALAEKKMDLDLVEAEANAPDQGNAKAPAGLLTEEQRYKRFATGLSGVGVNAVAQMIAKALVVGIMDVFRDWQAILAVWKR
ncbi:hypothetical protein K504DRAFT_508949 [Pleomassaria siparia CBS 279.74]|uniref:Uncharacterized protein n=1 Tax=Pleomassaria siparia CBS 279.74 TaxID=1314801 RepID=A0A6G1JQS0_9PLEO|nr:hypothetical protein K504DRAFT_508949 [Pleomassaria siparia CBS 279.74]